MVNDASFLDRLLADPTDDATRLVYADWLEEKGDAESNLKAEFLRLTTQLVGSGSQKNRKKRRNRLQQLAAQLDTDWLAIVSRLAIENCLGKRKQMHAGTLRMLRFEYLCDRQWTDLTSTDTSSQRFCGHCRETVHYCDTIVEAQERASRGQCIAVDLGVIRRRGDVMADEMMMGRISPAEFERLEALKQPDAVSAERLRRKEPKAADSDPTGSD